MTVDELPDIINIEVTETDIIVASAMMDPIRGDGLAIALRREYPDFDWRSGWDLVHIDIGTGGPSWRMDKPTSDAVIRSVEDPPDLTPFIARLTLKRR